MAVGLNAATEHTLRESEARFRALIENSLDVTVIIGADAVVRYVSPAVERILGYRPESLTGETSFDFVHPDDNDALQQMLARAASNPEVMQTNEFRALHEDGTWRRMEAVALNLLEDPAVAGMVMTARDVTERRALEGRLRQAEQLEAVGQIAGGMAHDFNNVLLVIRGYSSVLCSSLEDPQHLADVDEIAKAADRAAELTRQLLAFGRRQVLESRTLSLADAVRGTEPLLRRTIPEHIAIEFDLAGGIPPVLADPAQIERVIGNLVANAQDAMAEGGTVTISVAEIHLTGAEETILPPLRAGRYAVLTVSDTGSGIAADVVPHIFEPFFTTKSDGVGSGLGLSTVYGIVAQSGGGMQVQSPQGGGAAVSVYLPEATGAIDDTPASGDAISGSLARGAETVLLVEDEDSVREFVCRVLESAGYHVLRAGRPSEAERLLEVNHEIDLLVTDVVMPEMSGYDLARSVRERRPDIRALFISGYAHHATGIPLADGELLKKPFAPEELTRAVRTALDDDGRGEVG